MTLIEILMVIAIMAIVVAGASFGLRSVRKTHLRSAAVRLVAACQYAYHRAVTQGTTVRVALSLDEHTLALEEAHAGVVLGGEDEDDSGGLDPWRAAEARIGGTLTTSIGESPFAPIKTLDGDTIEKYQAKPIGDGVRIARLTTPHTREPVESGLDGIYFFAGGRTEKAAVYLADDDNEIAYTVTINALTGQAKVLKGNVDYEDAFGESPRDPG